MEYFLNYCKVVLLLAMFSNSSAEAVVLEPFTCRQDCETRELSAWAFYPLWQDTSYDPNFRVGRIVPGDPFEMAEGFHDH